MKHLFLIKKSQRGVGLLEALIAVALSSIVILGGVYSMSRMLVSQQQNNLQYIVINDLRTKLQSATAKEREDWCAGGLPPPTITLPKQEDPINITVTCKKVGISIINSNPTYNRPIPDVSLAIKFEINEASLGEKITVGEALE
ncbi:prepilin-type N-terminal cleavage/methylation domain-containing protein [Psychrobacter aquimaris]|uniref:prepilin-type N-terminal cleavage/methylation domain-containing protein n=1 Tax=Psychrobacter aquimaris TaxID=292733 RepID=UPI0018DFAAFD|nr:prepilin-type N-terminal cleavage/methylation domain-containing protein [Psychrobacter aquimaris]